MTKLKLESTNISTGLYGSSQIQYKCKDRVRFESYFVSVDSELFVWLCSKLNYLWLDQTFDWLQKSIDKFLVPEPESGTQWVNCLYLFVFCFFYFLIFPPPTTLQSTLLDRCSDILDNIVPIIIIIIACRINIYLSIKFKAS